MPNFFVQIMYDPGTPKSYIVEGVKDHDAAREHIFRRVLFYDPGVPVVVTQTPILTGETRKYSNLGTW